MSEYGNLGRMVARQGQGWRLRKQSQEGLYCLTDAATNGVIADDLTASEVGKLCAGEIGLAQLRLPAVR